MGASKVRCVEGGQEVARVIEWLRGRLRAAASAEFRAGQRWFFKEEVDPYGVRTAELKPIGGELYRAVKAWPAAERNRLCTEMWKSGKLEEGVLVCHLYRRFGRNCLEPEFRLFESWLDRYVNNWAHCDGLSTWLFAACIANRPGLADELAGWVKSRNRWRRRAAAVSLLQEAKAGRSLGHILDIATRLASDEDVMVQKGVGWLLKEAYPKRPDAVTAFLAETGERFSRLTLRYAAEKMSSSDKEQMLHR